MSLILDGSNGITFPNSSTQAVGFYGFKNRIINGAMVIDQRNAGASVTPTNGQYTVDRWQAAVSAASKFTVQQNAGSVTPPVGFSKYLGCTSSSAYTVGAGEVYSIQQAIEGNNIYDLAFGTSGAKATSLSFWVYSSLTGTFSGTLQNSAQTYSYVFTYSVPTANTWTYITVSIPAQTAGAWNTDNTSWGVLRFCLGVGSTYQTGSPNTWVAGNYWSTASAVSVVSTSGATFYITGVQLEVGSTATSFDYRPYGTELALCQRYYYKQPASTYQSTLLDGANSDYPSIYVTHPVDMRTTPSTVFESSSGLYYNNGTGQSTFTPSGGTTAYSGNSRVGIARFNAISNGPGSTQTQKSGQWTAQLSFSAEL